MTFELLFKCIILGDSGVGKTCLMTQLKDKKFQSQHVPTLGVEFGIQRLTIDERTIKLQIWDTTGQEAFRSITRSYFRGAACAILVYDVTKKVTFQNLTFWLNDLRESSGTNVVTILVGNKCDLESERVISTQTGATFAKENGLIFLETSAKSGKNVREAFLLPTKEMYKKVEDGIVNVDNETNGVQLCQRLSSQSSTTKKGCCWL